MPCGSRSFSGDYTAGGPWRLRWFRPVTAATFVVMAPSTLWIFGRLYITQLEVFFLFHFFVVLDRREILVGLRTAESNRSAVRGTSESAMTAVMMPLIFVGSAFSSGCVPVMGRSTMVSSAARIFLRLLIAELHALLLFWHCFVTSCFWFVRFVCDETR